MDLHNKYETEVLVPTVISDTSNVTFVAEAYCNVVKLYYSFILSLPILPVIAGLSESFTSSSHIGFALERRCIARGATYTKITGLTSGTSS